ncbi:(2R)-sulfolactate sulfo-lyase subunit beta [Saezia sanguinis]|uniref:(2R)-sulfolactate sulfo-lyase subunit beta n=1 Tax=Saezia sanguinis TaxID=1965230 RepID=A0A433SBD9_9BURK|nr:UxaA family hydrolase [Saezia sanguinis]RUS65964.1 (2R)-sulfolactate sulfo-lyase subunit beta [Saezia sanguinis]
MNDSFWGYERENGQYGIRNHVAIIPSVFCAAKVAERIAQNVPRSIFMRHPVGCSQVGNDLDTTAQTLIGIGRNPNIAAVVVVGLGCERFKAKELAEGIASTGKRLETVVIQEEGDTLRAIEKGSRIAQAMLEAISQERRREASVSHLMIGLNCGGSDMTSGLVANPALGIASDRLVEQGGSSILSELTELLGTQHILARRAINEQVGKEIEDAINAMEEHLTKQTRESTNENRRHLISTGNYDGGLSSVVEKSLGSMKKSGEKAKFMEVFATGAIPSKRGLLLMDGPGHDGEVATGQVAAGAQIICFPTGRGTPSGFPGVPVVKITGNPHTYNRMRANIDINAGEVLSGQCSLNEMGDRIYQEILDVASGKLCKAEEFGHDELLCITRKP